MDPLQPLVITVHGINSDGEWQDLVEPILEPHCHCEPIRYRAYRCFGALRQFVGPWSLRVSFFALGAMLGDAAAPATPLALSVLGGFAALMAVLSIWPTPRTASQELLYLSVALGAGFLLQRLWLRGQACPFRLEWALVLWTAALALGVTMEIVTHAYGASAWIWQIVGLSLFLLSLIVPLLTTAFRAPWSWTAAWAYLLVLALLAAPWEAAWTRRSLLRWFEAQVLEKIADHRALAPELDPPAPVHIIAHSFGTYLTGMTLRRHAHNGLRVGRVILVGSVLARDYPWHELADGVEIFKQVRNEAGGRDIVVTLAGCAAWISSTLELGRAGRHGFVEEPEAPVHGVSHPLEHCEQCLAPSQEGRRLVHNVKLPTFRHSDAFLVLERVSAFWLPWLCEREAGEFWDFRRLCVQATIYEALLAQGLMRDRGRGQKMLLALTDQLKGRVWTWTQGRRPGVTFGQYVLLMAQSALAARVGGRLGRRLSAVEEATILKRAAERLDAILAKLRRRVYDGHLLAREMMRHGPRALSVEEKHQLRSLEPVTAVLQVIQAGFNVR